MKKIEKLSTTKRFGARYGPRNKIKVDKIERIMRAYQKCPYCTYKKVKRISLGVWNCDKCGARFTGQAYITAPKTIEEEPVDEQ